MVQTITNALQTWKSSSEVAFVLLDGASERGLCAGGDIRALYEAARSHRLHEAATFFREEYALNSLIASYPKHYIALMDGVVMGGGIGISAHGSRRIVTERSALAMPETGIGFIPDVGGTYLLGTAPDELGVYLALTTDRVSAADVIAIHLADLFVPSSELATLVAQVEDAVSGTEVDDRLRSFSQPAPAGVLAGRRRWIAECFAASSVEAIMTKLRESDKVEAHAAADEMEKKSPTALKVTLQALREARSSKDLTDSLRREYCMVMACLRHPDFVEGVLAAIIDKDRSPKWNPSSLAEVKPSEVADFFTPSVYPELKLFEAGEQEKVAAWQ